MHGSTQQPVITIIAAVADNGVIGKGDGLPWHLPADLKHFKQTTRGHTVIMGRKTFDTVGHPLPDRRNIVLSRNAKAKCPGAEVVSSMDSALALAHDATEVFILGGAEIYRLALPRVDRMVLTHVHANVEGDTHFPEIDFSQWHEADRREIPADEANTYPMSFVVYERLSGA